MADDTASDEGDDSGRSAEIPYEQMPHEMLVRILRRRDRAPKRRLGLVWERREIEHEDLLADTVPLVEADPALAVGNGPCSNLIIEGDNFEALKLLAMTHAGRLKCIYIDPPYNTGNRDFVYNDRFIGKDERFRQSTWLEFLYRRLTLARRLLADDGVLLVSINDDNRAPLEMLLNDVFAGMRVGSLVWRTRIGGNDTRGAFLSTDHEHVLVYAGAGFRFGGRPKTYAMYANPDNDARGPWRKSDLTGPTNHIERPNRYYPLYDAQHDVWYPCNPDRVWAYASERLSKGENLKTRSIEQFVDDGKILFPPNPKFSIWRSSDELYAAIDSGNVPRAGGAPLLRRGLPNLEFWIGKRVGWGMPAFKRHQADLQQKNQPLSSWIAPNAYSEKHATTDATQIKTAFNDEGSKHVQSIFGSRVFSYPKPPSLIRELLRQSTSDDDLVLDFFAGSGTTAAAMMALNAEDGGKRRFIMVSSSEQAVRDDGSNLARDVLRERIAREVERHGYDANAAYLRLRSLPAADLLYDLDDAHALAFALLAEDFPLPAGAPPEGGTLFSHEGRHVAVGRRFPAPLVARINDLPPDEPLTIWTWTPARVADWLKREASVVSIPMELDRRLARLTT
jgi:adenine-specific DNA-methyltransferase